MDAGFVEEKLNEEHLAAHAEKTELSARIASYELAYRMQMEAASVVDLSRETASTRERYGLDEKLTADFERKCLMRRRLLEKGIDGQAERGVD